jgi:hypothetical protein
MCKANNCPSAQFMSPILYFIHLLGFMPQSLSSLGILSVSGKYLRMALVYDMEGGE